MKKFPAILCALVLCLMCATAMAEGESHPKYVFMFIGDGMGNPQVTATQYYLGSIENPDSKFPVPADLSFTKFPYLGLVTTYDSSSFCPDSASTATSMASGKKTLSGVINYDETLTNPFSMAVSHIMNNKAGLSYTSYAHTGLQIPVYAYGVGAEKFSGLYDNTGIFTRTMDAMGLTADAEQIEANQRAGDDETSPALFIWGNLKWEKH